MTLNVDVKQTGSDMIHGPPCDVTPRRCFMRSRVRKCSLELINRTNADGPTCVDAHARFVWSQQWGGEAGPQCCSRFMLSNLLPTQHSPQPGESSHLPHTVHPHTLLCVVSACTPIPCHPPHQHPPHSIFTIHTHTLAHEASWTTPSLSISLSVSLYPFTPPATSSPISSRSVQMFRLTTATTLNKHRTALSCSTNYLSLPLDTLAHPNRGLTRTLGH